MRTEVLLAQLKEEVFFAPQNIVQNILDGIESWQNKNTAPLNTTASANNSVALKQYGKIAVIEIDGAMYKKDMSGMCMSVASYQTIESKINEAKSMYNNNTITATGFRVTSPGGSVFGLDSVSRMIKSLEMPTFTIFEDQGASAAIYAFTGVDKIYAAPMTELGSIGTVVHIENSKEGKSYKAITSRRAKNKAMDLTKKEDLSRLQDKLDIYENQFYMVVEQNTGFTAEQIETYFNSGDTIMEDKALEIGFIDEIISFEDLIEREMGGKTAMPTASSNKLANSTERNDMEFNQDNFNALLEENKVLKANKETLENRVFRATTNAETLQLKLEDLEKLATSKEAEFNNKLEATMSKAYEAIEIGASKEAFAIAAKTEDKIEASKVLLNSISSQGSFGGGDSSQPEKSAILAWAEQNKGSIR